MSTSLSINSCFVNPRYSLPVVVVVVVVEV